MRDAFHRFNQIAVYMAREKMALENVEQRGGSGRRIIGRTNSEVSKEKRVCTAPERDSARRLRATHGALGYLRRPFGDAPPALDDCSALSRAPSLFTWAFVYVLNGKAGLESVTPAFLRPIVSCAVLSVSAALNLRPRPFGTDGAKC